MPTTPFDGREPVDSAPVDKTPKAIGLIRSEISGMDAPRHAIRIRRRAEELGYRYLYTVRPLSHWSDPIGYAMRMALDIGATALVVFDLATVDHSPARVCNICHLETVVPGESWQRAKDSTSPHAAPDHLLDTAEAQRIMRDHIACRAVLCSRKARAFEHLVRVGKIVPARQTPRERAAARGIAFETPFPSGSRPIVGTDMQTLLDVLAGLGDPNSDIHTLVPCAAKN